MLCFAAMNFASDARNTPPRQTVTNTASAPTRLLRFNKPYGVLSQFTPEGRWRGLKDFIAIPDVDVARHNERLDLCLIEGGVEARLIE